MIRKRYWFLGILFSFILLLLSSLTASAQQTIKLGALQDLTGATSDVGKDEALGVKEAVQYYNGQGGINGKRIKLFQYDYGYRVPEAVTTYKRFRDYDKVVMVLGWGTGDTEALSPTINADKMPYLSSSFSSHLCDPKKTPYNFAYGTEYSTNAHRGSDRAECMRSGQVAGSAAPAPYIRYGSASGENSMSCLHATTLRTSPGQ